MYDQTLAEERTEKAYDAMLDRLAVEIPKTVPDAFLEWLTVDPPQAFLDLLAKHGGPLAEKWLETSAGKAYAKDAFRSRGEP